MPDVAIVEIEIIGRIGGRLEQRDRVAPMIARALAHGIGVDRRERGEIARGQGSGPRPPREIAGELRPVSRLQRSEEHTSELQSLMRTSYAVFCLKKKIRNINIEVL